jgi:hypothetical protein
VTGAEGFSDLQTSMSLAASLVARKSVMLPHVCPCWYALNPQNVLLCLTDSPERIIAGENVQANVGKVTG